MRDEVGLPPGVGWGSGAGESGVPYGGLGAVVATDVRVLLAEALVELELAKVGQQLDSTALHGVLAEVHHAVEVVEVRGLGRSVTLPVHCDDREKEEKQNLEILMAKQLIKGL